MSSCMAIGVTHNPHPNPLPQGEGAVSPCSFVRKAIISANSIGPFHRERELLSLLFGSKEVISVNLNAPSKVHHRIYSPLDGSPWRGSCQPLHFGSKEVISVNLNAPSKVHHRIYSPLDGAPWRGSCQPLHFGSKEVISVNLNAPSKVHHRIYSPLDGAPWRGSCQPLNFGSKEVISVNLNTPIQDTSPHFQPTRWVPLERELSAPALWK
ncbi:Uncharacterised protein [Serratia fonticola]|nr:Uncharacterised protein [Serratia fonticola]